MPTGVTCNYPEHHNGPSGGLGLGWITALVVGAVVVAFRHVVVVALVVTAVLIVAAVPVLLLVHNHRRHYDPELERIAALEQRRVIAAEQRRLAAQERPAIAPVHQHLHIHVGSADDAAEIIRREQPW